MDGVANKMTIALQHNAWKKGRVARMQANTKWMTENLGKCRA